MTAAAPGWSLRRELTRILLLTALLPALVFGVALLWSQWQRDRGDLLLRLDANARLSANAFDDFLEGQVGGMVLLGGDAAALGREGAALERLLRTYGAMSRAAWFDGKARVVASRASAGKHAPAAAAFDAQGLREVLADGRPRVSGALPAQDGMHEIALSTPVLHGSQRDGALQAMIPIERFTRVRSDNLRLRGLELLVLDAGNRVVHASEGLRWKTAQSGGALGDRLRAAAVPASQAGHVQHLSGLLVEDGDAYLNAVRMRAGWVVAVVAPEQRLLAPYVSRLGLLLLLVGVTLMGVLLALWRLRRVMGDGLGYLLASLRGYALGGQIDHAQSARMPEELQPLAEGIGELAARMNAAFDDLRKVLDEREHMIAQRTESLRRAVGDLDRLSRTDGLTGSLNYRGFQEAGARLWQAAQSSGKPLSVLALDIDFFKRYNDLYGHAAGDEALRALAQVLGRYARRPLDVVARYGGEEFVGFWYGLNEADILQILEEVRAEVERLGVAHARSDVAPVLTLSIGLAWQLPQAHQSLADALRLADVALYLAKEQGRNRLVGKRPGSSQVA